MFCITFHLLLHCLNGRYIVLIVSYNVQLLVLSRVTFLNICKFCDMLFYTMSNGSLYLVLHFSNLASFVTLLFNSKTMYVCTTHTCQPKIKDGVFLFLRYSILLDN